MTVTVPRHALPHEDLGDRLRRWLSMALALFAPLPPLPLIPVTYGMGTIPVTAGAPWETETTVMPALTDERIAAIEAGAA